MITAIIIIVLLYLLTVSYCLFHICMNDDEVRRSVKIVLQYLYFCFILFFAFWFRQLFKTKKK